MQIFFHLLCWTVTEWFLNEVLSALNFMRHTNPSLIHFDFIHASRECWSFIFKCFQFYTHSEICHYSLSALYCCLCPIHCLRPSLPPSLSLAAAADLAAYVHKLSADLYLLPICSAWALTVIHNIDCLDPSYFLARRNRRARSVILLRWLQWWWHEAGWLRGCAKHLPCFIT